ncbi:hypothetical protein [Acinetobacter sp.]|uniref:hypothetical protein n=1 Tax=Acinetobacter sp. TaxID=472 RepID=UPI00388E0C84
MGEHIDTRGPRRKKTNEGKDILDRKRRVTFKNYIRELEEEELMNDNDLDDFNDEGND